MLKQSDSQFVEDIMRPTELGRENDAKSSKFLQQSFEHSETSVQNLFYSLWINTKCL